MNSDDKSTGWHTTSDSASGVAHFWERLKDSSRRSLCGRVVVKEQMQDASQTIRECARCRKALLTQVGVKGK